MTSLRGALTIGLGIGLGLPACAETDPPNLVRKTIGPRGGLITSHDRVLSVALLPGAVTDEVELEVFPSQEAPAIFGLSYRVRPDIELLVDAEITYRRVLPSNPNAAVVGAIRIDDYGDEMGHWQPLPRLLVSPEQQAVIATDHELSLYYGLLEVPGAPPLPTDDTGTDPTPPATDEGTTGEPDEGTTGSTDEGTTTMPVDPTTSDGGSATTNPVTSAGMSSSDDGAMESSSDGMVMPPMCADGMAQAGELCLVDGGDFATGLGPIDVGVADFDGGAGLDVVTLDGASLEVGLLSGNGDGTFQMPATAGAVGGTPVEFAVGDFTGDGASDVVLLDTATDAVGLMVGDGTGLLAAPIDTAAGVGVVDLSAGDFDGDAATDVGVLVAGDQTLQILLGGAGGMVLAGTAGINVGVDATVAVGDYNGAFDGFDDIMGLGPAGFHAWATDGTGAGFLGDVVGGFGGGGTFVELVSGDLTGDGNDDVVALDVAGDAIVFGVSTGAPASFMFAPPVAVGTDPVDVVLADLDGDGIDEIVVCHATSNDVHVYEYDGGMGLTLLFAMAAGTTPSGVAVGDFDGDGVLDIVVSSQASDTITVLLSDP